MVSTHTLYLIQDLEVSCYAQAFCYFSQLPMQILQSCFHIGCLVHPVHFIVHIYYSIEHYITYEAGNIFLN